MAKESVNILKDKIDIVDLLAQLNAAPVSYTHLIFPLAGDHAIFVKCLNTVIRHRGQLQVTL